MDGEGAEMSESDGGSFHPNTMDAGISIRRWYAGLAMQGMIACTMGEGWDDKVVAKNAFDMADAMIARQTVEEAMEKDKEKS
jgi:hypothetical protein